MPCNSRKFDAPYNPAIDEDEYFNSIFLHLKMKTSDPIEEANNIIRNLPRKLRRGYRGSAFEQGGDSRRNLEIAVDEKYKSRIIDEIENMGYAVEISGNSHFHEAESEDSLNMKIETLRGGLELFEIDAKNAINSQQKSYFKGMVAAFDATIRGLERFGYDRTLEEITIKLKPDAISNFEKLHQNNLKEKTYYYNAGKIKGYEEVIDYLSPFGVEFQEGWAAEEEAMEIDVNVISPKEAKLNIWIPLAVGFIGGTVATVVGNIWSEMWLKSNGHSRSVEVQKHRTNE